MDFFEKVTGTITSKGQEAVDKAKELAEVAKLKSQIASCEEVIKKNYMEIGRLYYEAHLEAAETAFEDDIYGKQLRAIENAKKGVAELEQEIQKVKGV